jgi:PTS system nitrogen regulatory IIA component
MNIYELIDKECIKIPLESHDKPGVIRELVHVLYERGKIADADIVFQEVWKREQMMTTGIGYGIALPHGKSEKTETLCGSLGLTAEPIDFASIDREPVRLVILLVARPDSPGPHIKAISKISRLLRCAEARRALLNATDADDAWQIIRQYEQQMGIAR